MLTFKFRFFHCSYCYPSGTLKVASESIIFHSPMTFNTIIGGLYCSGSIFYCPDKLVQCNVSVRFTLQFSWLSPSLPYACILVVSPISSVFSPVYSALVGWHLCHSLLWMALWQLCKRRVISWHLRSVGDKERLELQYWHHLFVWQCVWTLGLCYYCAWSKAPLR